MRVRILDCQQIQTLREQNKDKTKTSKSEKNKNYFINLELSVIDTGVGISSEGLEKLFLDFSKLEENEDMNLGGTGLGLSITKKIIEQMGGFVTVESQLNQGSSFKINIKTKCNKVQTCLIPRILKKINPKKQNKVFIKYDNEAKQLISAMKEQ